MIIKKKKISCAAMLICFVLLLTACSSGRSGRRDGGQTAGSEEEKDASEITRGSEKDSGTLEFVDAHGSSHEVGISAAVTKHSYDWSCLSGSGLGLSYDDDLYTSSLGVDVSVFSGAIDWETVRDAGVDFAFVRIGGRGYGEAGSLYEDGMAMTNIEDAQQAGLDVGVYFFSQAISTEEALEEADFVLGLLDGLELDLPVVFDPETIVDDEARTDDVSGEQFTRNVIAFCSRIREAGYETMVYCNMLWEAYELDLSVLEEAGIDIWYADYEPVPQTPYYFTCWQFAGDTVMEGIEGGVDLNMRFIAKE